MEQENEPSLTVSRLKSIHINLYLNKKISVFDIIDRMEDEEIQTVFTGVCNDLRKNGRI